jgi:DeoR/GlpR family transcriptional regulator of sugar metabolism
VSSGSTETQRKREPAVFGSVGNPPSDRLGALTPGSRNLHARRVDVDGSTLAVGWGGQVVLARNRQELILNTLRSNGSVRVSDLVRHLGVSGVTIRRDIVELSRLGLADRVHGGAALPEGFRGEPAAPARRNLDEGSEHALGQLAASLVQPGSSVALSAGRTTLAVAAALQGVPGLTVVTNSPAVAQFLHDPTRRDRTVVLTGGTLSPGGALVGPVACSGLAPLHVDLLFLGVHGFSAATGLTSPDLAGAETDRALMAAAACTVVVADSGRWGRVGLVTVAELDEVDVVVSDEGLPGAARELLRERGSRVLLAASGTR